ncbi:MAG: PEP-CTERM sorting domain-containing protein, partial [Phycisphaerae bacterium]|nr:PEP-CTERM sorting domain-containing protein [Phycisphaerae bacterium]
CFGACIALVALLVAATGYATNITSIHNNAFDGVSDAWYESEVLEYKTSDFDGAFNMLTVSQDGVAMSGWTGNVVLDFYSHFHDYGTTLPGQAFFTGGYLSLDFDYSPDQGATWQHCILSGVIDAGSVQITSTSPTLSTMSGVFYFDTAQGQTVMPDSNIWPATGLSTCVALTFAIGHDLSYLRDHAEAWKYDIIPDQHNFIFDTQFGFYPIPEPATGLLVFVVSGLVVARRRR